MYWEYKDRRVFYEVSGEGQDTVVLLHGWGCTHDIFSNFVPHLGRKHKVITLDFPGFGASAEPQYVWKIGDYEQFLEDFFDFLGIGNPVIIGHSFGGRVAIFFASRRKVSKLVLVDSAGIKPKRSASYYIKVWSFKIAKLFLSPKALEKRRRKHGSADYAAASPKMRAVLSAVVNQDLTQFLGGIQAPTLLFWGENDTATPVSDARKMEKLIPDAGLVCVPGGSHFSFLEAPDLFLRVLDSFL